MQEIRMSDGTKAQVVAVEGSRCGYTATLRIHRDGECTATTTLNLTAYQCDTLCLGLRDAGSSVRADPDEERAAVRVALEAAQNKAEWCRGQSIVQLAELLTEQARNARRHEKTLDEAYRKLVVERDTPNATLAAMQAAIDVTDLRHRDPLGVLTQLLTERATRARWTLLSWSHIRGGAV